MGDAFDPGGAQEEATTSQKQAVDGIEVVAKSDANSDGDDDAVESNPFAVINAGPGESHDLDNVVLTHANQKTF